MTADPSSVGKRNRAHGHETERMVARYLRGAGWPDAQTTRRKLGADGAKQPGDIDFEPGICLEVKSRKQSAWPSWREQVLAEAGGRIPIIVRRTRGVPDVGLWVAQVPIVEWSLLSTLRRTCFRCDRTNRFWVAVAFSDITSALLHERENA